MTRKFTMPVLAVIAALVLTLGLSAFNSRGKQDAKEPAKAPFTSTYFHFFGTPGQEDDETKWEQISALQYSGMYGGCVEANDGCRLTTESTQTIGGVLRPFRVDVALSGGHKNPIVTGPGLVTAVGNKNPQ